MRLGHLGWHPDLVMSWMGVKKRAAYPPRVMKTDHAPRRGLIEP